MTNVMPIGTKVMVSKRSGWVRHDGKSCPVSEGQGVIAMVIRAGRVTASPTTKEVVDSGRWLWWDNDTDKDSDIIWYNTSYLDRDNAM